MPNMKVPGGAYLQADKRTWIDANGKVIAAPRGEVYERPEEIEPVEAGDITPGAELLKPARGRMVASGSTDEFGAEEDLIEDEAEDKPKARRAAKNKS